MAKKKKCRREYAIKHDKGIHEIERSRVDDDDDDDDRRPNPTSHKERSIPFIRLLLEEH